MMKKSRFLFGLLFSACFIPNALFAVSNPFQPVISLNTGVSPRGVATGDVFGNGTKDLIVANFGSPTFIGQSTPASVLFLGNSSLEIFVPSPNGLVSAATIPTAFSPRGLSTLKLKGEADDILVTGYDANLLQIFGWQGGKFTEIDQAPTLNMPVGVAAGLTRPGGAPFVVVADYGANSISIYPVKNGKLGTRTDIPVDGGPTQVAVGALSGSGFNEIAVVCLSADKIDLLAVKSDDPSTYAMLPAIALPPGSSPSDLRLADLNHDGKTDMVVSDFSTNSITVYLQQPGGNLLAQTPVVTSGSHPNGLTVADLTGQGSPDIIVANRDSNSLDIFQWSGLQFALSQTLKVSGDSGVTFGPVEVAALDVTGQGSMALATSHMSSNSLKVFALDAVAQPTPTVLSSSRSNGGTFSGDTTYCYPNPTRGGDVKFSFQLSSPSVVAIRVFDVTGTAVWSETLQASQTQAGTNNIDWNLTNSAGQKLASGLYIYSVTVGGQSVIHHLAVLH
jgi:hypothetical protein